MAQAITFRAFGAEILGSHRVLVERGLLPSDEEKMTNEEDLLYSRWNTWFDQLDAETINLVIQRHMYGELGQVVNSNPRLQEPNQFLFWLSVWYSSAMSVAIRKLVDPRNDIISYRRLLEEIRDNPTVISRSRFRRNFVDANYDEGLADLDYDSYVGAGREHLDPTIVKAELNELANKTAKLKLFVNKRVAHRDEKEFDAIPKYRDLDEAIDFLGVLHKRYFHIFRCLGYDTLLPPLGDWKSVFRNPWLINN
jgi:hypothetical protein